MAPTATTSSAPATMAAPASSGRASSGSASSCRPLCQETGPPPFADLTRFHGVFAPRAKLRARVIPQPEAQAETRGSTATDTPSPTAALTPQTGTVLDVLPRRRRRRPKRHRYRTDWASLLLRVFLVDILTCAQCQGRLRVVAKVDNPDAVKAMLRHLGLLEDPEPDRPARDRDRELQLELAYDFGA